MSSDFGDFGCSKLVAGTESVNTEFPNPADVTEGIIQTSEKKRIQDEKKTNDRRTIVLSIVKNHLCDLKNGKKEYPYVSSERKESLLQTYPVSDKFTYVTEVYIGGVESLSTDDIIYLKKYLLLYGFYLSNKYSFDGDRYLIIGWNPVV